MACIKINGHVIVLKNALHILDLKSNLFSATQHCSNGTGCAFLIENGIMSVSFLSFSIHQDVPADGDLRLKLQPLTAPDWHLSSFECVRTKEITQEQSHLLNPVYFGSVMTRSQKQQHLQELRDKLQSNSSNHLESCDNNNTSTAPSNDRYISEGYPDESIKDYLSGLTIHDIRDYLNDNKLNDSNKSAFNKTPTTLPPQNSLESSCGNLE